MHDHRRLGREPELFDAELEAEGDLTVVRLRDGRRPAVPATELLHRIADRIAARGNAACPPGRS